MTSCVKGMSPHPTESGLIATPEIEHVRVAVLPDVRENPALLIAERECDVMNYQVDTKSNYLGASTINNNCI